MPTAAMPGTATAASATMGSGASSSTRVGVGGTPLLRLGAGRRLALTARPAPVGGSALTPTITGAT